VQYIVTNEDPSFDAFSTTPYGFKITVLEKVKAGSNLIFNFYNFIFISIILCFGLIF